MIKLTFNTKDNRLIAKYFPTLDDFNEWRRKMERTHYKEITDRYGVISNPAIKRC